MKYTIFDVTENSILKDILSDTLEETLKKATDLYKNNDDIFSDYIFMSLIDKLKNISENEFKELLLTRDTLKVEESNINKIL